RVLPPLMLQSEDAVDGRHLVRLAQRFFRDHVVLPEPVRHLGPDPKLGVVGERNRCREAAWPPNARDVLMQKLTAAVDLAGDVGLGDERTIYAKDVGPDLRLPHVADRAEDRVLERRR